MKMKEDELIKCAVERMMKMYDFVSEAIDRAPDGHAVKFEISFEYIEEGKCDDNG